jgi:hypothetical protein
MVCELVAIKAVAPTAAIDLAMKLAPHLLNRQSFGFGRLDSIQLSYVQSWLKIFVFASKEASLSDGKSPSESDDWLAQFVLQPFVALLSLFADNKMQFTDFLKCILSVTEFNELTDSSSTPDRWKEFLYSVPQSILSKFGIPEPPKALDLPEPYIAEFIEGKTQQLVKNGSTLFSSYNWVDIVDLEAKIGISPIYSHLAMCAGVQLFDIACGKTFASSRTQYLKAAAAQVKNATFHSSGPVALPILYVAAFLCDEIGQFAEAAQPEPGTIDMLAKLRTRISPKADALVAYSDRLKDMMQELRKLYEAFTSKITLSSAQKARSSLRALSMLQDILEIRATMTESELDREISFLQNLVASCRQRKQLWDWLRDNASDLKPISPSANEATEESLKNLTKDELQSLMREFVECAELAEDEYNMLLFFFSRQSALLFNFVSVVTEDVGSVKAISSALANLSQFLKSISDDKSITLANVTAIAATMNQFKHSLEEELNVISDFLKGSKLSATVIDERRQRLGNALELVKLAQLWSQAQGFFDKYRLVEVCPPEALDDIVKAPTHAPESISLEKAHELLNLAKKILGDGFKSFHLKLLNTLIVRSEVVMFFLNEGVQIIRNRIEVLSSDCQGDNSAMIILDNVTAVLKTLEPVVDFIATRKRLKATNGANESHVALRRFFDRIAAGGCLAGTEEAFDRQLKQIEGMAERLAEIRMLISQRGGHSLEALIPYVKKLAQSGYFRSCMSTGELVLLRSRDGEA